MVTRPTTRRTLLVRGAQRSVPVAVAVASEVDLPGLTAHRAVLHVRLPAPALVLEIQLDPLTAIRTHHGDEFAHQSSLIFIQHSTFNIQHSTFFILHSS